MEKWRLIQLERIAVQTAEHILSKKVPTDKKRTDFIKEEVETAVGRKRMTHVIEVAEENKLASLVSEQVERLMNQKLDLESGSPRFEIKPSPQRRKEKGDIGKFAGFERENIADPKEVYGRAAEMVKFLTKRDIPLDERQFVNEVRRLTRELQKAYPFLFNSKTGEPLTALQPAYIFGYELDSEGQSGRHGAGNATIKYRQEVLKLEEYVSKHVKRGLDKIMPKGLSNPIRLSAPNATEVMQHEGVVLYLPELYHGISPRLAEEHFTVNLQEDFRLCDPMQGLMISLQNMECLDRDFRLGQRTQAYHMVCNKEGRHDKVFGMVVSSADVGLSRVPYTKASSDVSSGLIYDPK